MATMTASTGQSRLRPMLQDLVSEATGREGRTDPVLPGTGGPAGNARLTAWTGMVLLALILAELVTLLDVHGMLGWHVAIGALLGPPAVLKTATTSWRLVRYYAGSTAYRRAGPPVTLLRLLGPLVVVSTWLLIGSGVLLVLLGPDSSRTTLFSVLGFRLSWLTVHQGSFVVWGVVTGIHVLSRLAVAYRLAFTRGGSTSRVPGAGTRVAALVVTAVLAIGGAVLLVHADGPWASRHDFHGSFRGDHGGGLDN
jgi:hypothetical protein